jgi:hypothetical protein
MSEYLSVSEIKAADKIDTKKINRSVFFGNIRNSRPFQTTPEFFRYSYRVHKKIPDAMAQ